jgi:hypothetical protein
MHKAVVFWKWVKWKFYARPISSQMNALLWFWDKWHRYKILQIRPDFKVIMLSTQQRTHCMNKFFLNKEDPTRIDVWIVFVERYCMLLGGFIEYIIWKRRGGFTTFFNLQNTSTIYNQEPRRKEVCLCLVLCKYLYIRYVTFYLPLCKVICFILFYGLMILFYRLFDIFCIVHQTLKQLKNFCVAARTAVACATRLLRQF